MATAIKKGSEVETAQWISTNKTECDAVAGETSAIAGPNLRYKNTRGRKVMTVNSWILRDHAGTGILTDTEFNDNYTIV